MCRLLAEPPEGGSRERSWSIVHTQRLVGPVVTAPRQVLAVARGGLAATDIAVEQREVAAAGPGDIVVELAASSLNPSDVANVTGRSAAGPLSFVPGRDLAGVVLQGPARLLGRLVWATGGDVGYTRDGFHAEQVVLPAAAVVLVPDALSALEAGTVGVAYTTAFYGLLELARLGQGEEVVVTGAAGAVGGAAVQVARWAGASRVVGVVQSEADAARALQVGADEAVPADELAAAVRSPAVCLDAVGGHLLDQVCAVLADRARVVVLATPGDGRVELDLRGFYRKELQLHGLNTGYRGLLDGARALNALAPGFADGQLRPLPVAAGRCNLPPARRRPGLRRRRCPACRQGRPYRPGSPRPHSRRPPWSNAMSDILDPSAGARTIDR